MVSKRLSRSSSLLLAVGLLTVPAAANAQQVYGETVGEDPEFEVTTPVAACEDIVPYLQFTTNLDEGDVTIDFVDTSGISDPDAPDLGPFDDGSFAGTIRATSTVTVGDGTSPDSLLWPGMVLDGSGEPVDWPGWEPVLDEDGAVVDWDQVDDGFGWARTDDPSQLVVVVTFEDESLVFPVTYAAPDTDCYDPPEVTDVGGIGTDRDPDPDPEREPAAGGGQSPSRGEPATAVLGRTLSRTGADTLVLALGGLGLLGLGVLSVRRTRPARVR